MAYIESWFPTVVYIEKELFPKNLNDQWSERIFEVQKTTPSGGYDWQGKTYTTHIEYDLRNDEMFEALIDSITEHVREFAEAHGSQAYYKCQGAWANIATADNFQEYHTHDGSVFSAVYYPRVPEGSGHIVFEDPRMPDMLPIGNITERNGLSFQKVGYEAEEGMLIIFRSSLRHAVYAGTNKEPRISFAFNFGPGGV